MIKIPDDVVERALDVALERKKFKKGDLTLEEYEYAMAELRAAGRVFVEWEREWCAKIAEGSFPFNIEMWINSTKKEMTAHTGNAIAAAIRSRTNPDDCNPSDYT